MRLAYVQHPFPAQGQTTDTTHLIASEHATQQGTYVALTRARHRTHIHANHLQTDSDQDQAESTRRAPEPHRTRHPIHPHPARPRTPHPQPPPTTHHPRQRPARTRNPSRHPSTPPRTRSSPGSSDPDPDPTTQNTRPGSKPPTPSTNTAPSYHIDPDEPILLGPQPPAGEFQQRHHRNQTRRLLLDAVHELQPPALNHHTPTTHTIDPAAPSQLDDRDHQHTPGWEP